MKIRNMFYKVFFPCCLIASCILSGCTTLNPYTDEKEFSKTAIGPGIGAAGGALLGQLIGGNTKSTLIGAGIGAVVGGGTGYYMDRQATDLRERLQGSGVRIMRNGQDLRLIMPSNITFANNVADIRSSFFETLSSVALVLRKFDKTTIQVAGYASSVGNAMYNQELSEKRAISVANYLISQGINANRITPIGYGERFPIATNTTPAGQELNRRVEITIRQIA